jgi:FAD/FMN-containing dehydrogenase
MIDLSLLSAVTVDPETRRARVGGGALLADMDAATQAYGLAVPTGLVSHTGVGGLTLGGGMGWLTRKFGLTIDNLLSAEIVTADGQVQRATPDQHPDLFWAIRGGGGNFGVVTSFELQLHEVDPLVQFGLFFWSLDQGPEALRLAREITASMPPDINAVVGAVNAPPAPFVPEQHHFAPGYVLLLTGFDGAPEHAQLADQIRESLPPLFDLVTPMPYVELQKLLDEANAWGLYCYEKGTYVEDLSDEVIDVVTSYVPQKNSPMSILLFYRLDGAYCRASDEETAFSGGRSPRYGTFIVAVAPDAGLLAADRGWVRDAWEALRPHAIGSGDGYINGTAELGGDRVRGSYGAAKYERLARIKGEHDPDNLFHLNANIRPA